MKRDKKRVKIELLMVTRVRDRDREAIRDQQIHLISMLSTKVMLFAKCTNIIYFTPARWLYSYGNIMFVLMFILSLVYFA